MSCAKVRFLTLRHLFSVIDAMGKPSSNLLGMHLKWVGSYDECMKVIATVNISGEITSPYKGKYCGASLKTSKVMENNLYSLKYTSSR